MVNGLYDKGRAKFLNGNLSWSTLTIKTVLVDTASYAANLISDEFLAIIPAGMRTATSVALANKTYANGVADADDLVLANVSGNQSEALVIYNDTGNANTSDLIAYIDTATGLAVTPNGANITIQWNANGIFKL